MSNEKIRPNDFILHIPSGEEWVVCGVNYADDGLIPCGYPFPSMAKLSDCKLLESRWKPQTQEQRNTLKQEHLYNYIDVAAAMLDDDLSLDVSE